MDFETIKFEEPEAGIGLLTLNRPDRLNAMSFGMLHDLYELFSTLKKRRDIRVLVLTGAGRGFSSGADLIDVAEQQLAEVMKNAADYLVDGQQKYSGIVLEMRRLSQPIIAAVNGVAAGGGMCLALASDVIYAGPNAKFIPSFINIGLSGAELGLSYFLPKMIGSVRAAEIMMTGRTVNAEEAERMGLVCRTVKEEELLNTAMETARTMLGKSKHGLWMTKDVLNSNLNATNLEVAINMEDRNQSLALFAPDFLKAIARFNKE